MVAMVFVLLGGCAATVDPQTYYIDSSAPAAGIEAAHAACAMWSAVGHHCEIVIGTSGSLSSRILFDSATYGCNDPGNVSCEQEVLQYHKITIGWGAVETNPNLSLFIAHEIGHGFGYDDTQISGHIMCGSTGCIGNAVP